MAGSFQLNADEGGMSAANPKLPGLVLDLQGWTQARQIYEVAANGQVRNTGLQPQGPFDAPTDIEATEVQVKSHDGALVPMSVLHKKGLKLDGSHPTIVYGYASYGVTEEPFYSVSRMAWLDAGGVIAFTNPRGSSVYGQDWYKAGFQATKPNTWKDAIACAEWLVAQGYTTPARQGVWGGSAGGILVGRAITERPDLFAVAVPQVGVMDMLRFQKFTIGWAWVSDYGSSDNAEEFKRNLDDHVGPLASWTAWVVPTTMKPSDAARRVGVSEATLREINRIPPRMVVKAGSTLLVPRTAGRNADVSEHLAENATMALAPDVPPTRRVVQRAGKRGESVASVARRNGVSAAQVAQWNGLSAGGSFKPGASIVLNLPNRQAAAASAAPARSVKPTSGRARR